MKVNISVKIIGVVFLLSLILFSILTYTTITNYREDLTESFVERARATTYSLDAGIARREDFQDKTMLLSNIHKLMWLDAEVIDVSFSMLQESGMITYLSSDPNRIDKPSDIDNIDSYEKDTLISEIVQTREKRILKVIAPMHVSGQAVGTVQIDFTLEDVDSKIESATNIMISDYLLLMVLFILVLFFSLRKIVITPILKVNKGAEAIAKNDFNYRVDVKSNDEIGRLSRTFNQMTIDLKESRKKLEEYSKELEKQVADRTKELEKSKNELESKVDEMERFSKLSVGRELRMVELKKKVRELEEKRKKHGTEGEK